ncbi:MAG: phosphotransferase [Desulfohalobiaceae bacterium]|nr:phosphotransferase [Desulfohalobiaceae bacterium]
MDIHTLSRLNRFRAIVVTLIKYGFGDIIARLDLPEKLGPFYPRKQPKEGTGTYTRIRLALQELGPTFIKLGQLLSLRTDLIPSEMTEELSKLQDEVPAEQFSEISKQIERALGRQLSEVFSEFEEKPMAAASLAQVHGAVLRDSGELVAIKVQRPGIRQMIRNDLRIMESLAQRAHERVESLQLYNLPRVVEEIKRLLTQELDFRREGRNIRLARSNFAGDTALYLPRVHSDISTTRMLVLERIQGTKLRDALTSWPLEVRRDLARKWLRATLKQILEDGFFHADPHPGNFFILSKGKYSLLDWGMVGRLTPETRIKLVDLLGGVVLKDSQLVLDLLLEFTEYRSDIDMDGLHRELMDILDDYHSVPLKEINMGRLLTALTEMLRNHQMQLTMDLSVMIKAIVTSEGSARMLDPDLNVISEAAPYIRRLARQKYSPQMILRTVRSSFRNLWRMQQSLPVQINHIMDKLQRDELTIGFEHKRLEGLRRTLNQVANRLTLALVTASMIIGSSMIITTGVKPLLFGYPALGLVGYLLSGLFGCWLIVDILRKRKF